LCWGDHRVPVLARTVLTTLMKKPMLKIEEQQTA